MNYAVEIKPKVLKQLKKIDVSDRDRILDKIYLLGKDPFPVSSKSLKGRNDRSMRVGSYRVLYEVMDGKLVVLVLAIGHRKDVYRK